MQKTDNSTKFNYKIFRRIHTTPLLSYECWVQKYLSTSPKWNNKISKKYSYSNNENISKIKNIIPELCFLDSKNLLDCYLQKIDYQYYPKSLIAYDSNDLQKINFNTNLFIIKPAGNCRNLNKYIDPKLRKNGCFGGRGIEIAKSVEEVKKIVQRNHLSCGYVVQKCLTNLDLVNGRIYSLRTYLLIYSYKGELNYYMYDESFIRLGTSKYKPNPSKPEEIVTNRSFQSKLKGYNPINQLKILSQIDKNGIRKKKIIDCLTTLTTHLKKDFPSPTTEIGFMLLGCDLIFDKQLDVYLLEINYNPAFKTNNVNQNYINLHKNLITDLVDHFFEPSLLDKNIDKTGKWTSLA